MLAALFQTGTSHADPVVPILLALVFVTLGAVIGGRLMTSLRQPTVLGEFSGFGCPSHMNRWAVGIGMMPRGEVGLIFAGIGKGIGVIDDGLFSAVVILVMVTTLLAPIFLRLTVGSRPAGTQQSAGRA